MLVIWKERANPRRARAGAESAVMSSPAKRTRPRSGRRLPASWLISVVLPAPFGPMMAWVSPSRTSRLTSSLASSAQKLFVRPRTSRRALFILAEEQSREAAPEEEHRQHQQRTQDQLPVLRPARERVLDQEQREGAEHRPGDAPHAAADHHDEAGVDHPLPEEKGEDEDREHQVVEGGGVVEVDEPRKLALHREAH